MSRLRQQISASRACKIFPKGAPTRRSSLRRLRTGSRRRGRRFRRRSASTTRSSRCPRSTRIHLAK
eukprot:7584365-Pyramimonas_sp.AAC.1